ncbi:MAG: DUF2997 domain-containing protein [Myxococcales bacterium]|nr:DUF2997 domain-containing protein [Myxococcales bacterium]MCB9551809.1 DUF2997 domain-containing protein [Myxococcales bacterium]
MAVRHEIDIQITPSGEVKLQVKGVAGAECLELTRRLEEELGLVVEREKTSEYFQAEAETERTVKIGEDD